MRKGDVFEVTVARLGAQGDGLARVDGRPLYIPLALPDETVRVQVGRSVGDGYQAALQEVLTPSPQRVAPPCPHFAHCGGCATQHLAPSFSADWKTDVVRGALAQHDLSGTEIRPIRTVPPASRRRLTLAALDRRHGTPWLGFNARASHQIVDIGTCPVARPELVRLLPLLRLTLTPWIRAARALDISLTLTDSGVDLLVTGAEPDRQARETAALMLKEPSISRLSWRATERATPETVLMVRQPVVSFDGVPVALPPGAFLQPTAAGEKILAEVVGQALTGTEGRLADLFAGCGSFSFPMARFGEVRAVEGDSAALTALSAATLHQRRVTAEHRDLFRDPLTARELEKYAAVVFDPPRAGAATQCAALAGANVPVIVAVSCNPGTFARDAATLVAGGYRLEWVQPVDQFLWSSHVELVARFSRP